MIARWWRRVTRLTPSQQAAGCVLLAFHARGLV